MCQQCGKNFNVPPLNPPAACMEKMATRSDDNLDVINNRLEVRIQIVQESGTLWC